MSNYENKSLLRFTTAGSVDDGKSTLIGRLLYETNCIYEDQYMAIEKTSLRKGNETVDLSLLLDGLAAEREQGITIDVSYRYFTTKKRKFIIADTPGHEEYTRNMITGASTAELAIILIDARKGVMTQSRRHGFLLSLLQMPHLVVIVNKMDLVGYFQDKYNEIVEEYKAFSEKLDIQDITFIPVSALDGDNVVKRSQKMPWYEGHTLLHHLENVNILADKNLVDFRFPVQNVIRPHLDFRGFAGKISSGTISVGEEIAVLPSGNTSKVKSIVTYDAELEEAFSGQSVVLTLEDEIDISRGDMIVRKNNIPQVDNDFETIICWMDEEKADLSKHYILKHTTQKVKAFIQKVNYIIDVNTLHRDKEAELFLNQIAKVNIKTSSPLFFDNYKTNQATGSFILIDPDTNHTVAAGMIKGKRRSIDDISNKNKSIIKSSPNVLWENVSIARKAWEERNGHEGVILWFTGLSGSGKTTIAHKVTEKLFELNTQVIHLDGDNVRHGLCGDLNFSEEDRSENIRRVGEVANILFNQGNIVVCTFISPFAKDRRFVRSLFPKGKFIEVFTSCDLEVCKVRDPKGLYQKIEAGEIKNFTGISSRYETPMNPDIFLETEFVSVEESVDKIVDMLVTKQIIKPVVKFK